MNRFLYTVLVALPFLCGNFLFSQDTVLLKEVDVTARKTHFSFTGKKIQETDSLQKQQFVFSSVGDLLSFNSPVFIKNYGPGSISSSAFRGGSASHTGIIWNGFNIQNAMLGQTDLSLLPTVIFDNISVEYGGSSALWGSGAVAGSIHLNNQLKFNRGITTKANIGGGSFGLFNASAAIEQSQQRFISSTKLYTSNSANTFLFKDTLDKEHPLKEQRHAAYSSRGLMQEVKFLRGTRHLFSASAWFNEALREIPVFSKYSISRPEQKDVNFKSSAAWNYAYKKLNSTLRAAGFYDELHYRDAGFEISSSAWLNTIIIENENIFSFNERQLMNFGVNHTRNTAFTKDYKSKKSLYRTSLNAGTKLDFFDKRFVFLVNARAEQFSLGNLQLTGNTAIEYKPVPSLSAKLNVAKVYRQPTLNELYWNPGGNENLLPEEGYTTEGDLQWAITKNNFIIKIGGSAFLRMIDNWILWLPANNLSTPVNVQKVISRGTETQSKIIYRKNKTSCALNVNTSYVLSTVSENDQENGGTLGRQLIYTPRYLFNSNVSFGYSMFSITVYHQYTGYRFISSDNLQWLPPYHIFNARVNFATNIASTRLIIFAACNNIIDKNYAVVAARPMPLRNFEFGISLNHNKQKQQQTTE